MKLARHVAVDMHIVNVRCACPQLVAAHSSPSLLCVASLEINEEVEVYIDKARAKDKRYKAASLSSAFII